MIYQYFVDIEICSFSWPIQHVLIAFTRSLPKIWYSSDATQSISQMAILRSVSLCTFDLFVWQEHSLESCGILVAIHWETDGDIQCCNNVVVIQSQVSVISVIVRKMLIHVSFFLLQLFYTTKISLQNLGLSEKKVLEP